MKQLTALAATLAFPLTASASGLTAADFVRRVPS